MEPIALGDVDAVFFDRGNLLYDCRWGPTDEQKLDDAATSVREYLSSSLGIESSIDQIRRAFLDPWQSTFSSRRHTLAETPVKPYLVSFTRTLGVDVANIALDEIIDRIGFAYTRWHVMNPMARVSTAIIRPESRWHAAVSASRAAAARPVGRTGTVDSRATDSRCDHARVFIHRKP